MVADQPLFPLCLITDRLALGPGGDLLKVVEQALRGGVPAVQLREKDLTSRELFDLASEIRNLTRRHHARLLINDRVDVALAVGADGVHLGHQSLPVAKVRSLLGHKKLIGVSTHRLEEILPAARQGANFLTFSPVYFTPSKAGYGPAQGLERLQSACRTSPIPVLALGGIRPEKLAELRAAGASGIALISAILNAEDPRKAASNMMETLAAEGFCAAAASL
ncbi:MAG: thiamine phosphate synthase [Syntrophotaleaceae bacterium]